MSAVAARGAHSRKSSAASRPSAMRSSRKPPPPRLPACGCVTASASATATAASTALPPSCRTCRPIRVACGSAVTTAAFSPRATRSFGTGGAGAARIATSPTSSVAHGLIGPASSLLPSEPLPELHTLPAQVVEHACNFCLLAFELERDEAALVAHRRAANVHDDVERAVDLVEQRLAHELLVELEVDVLLDLHGDRRGCSMTRARRSIRAPAHTRRTSSDPHTSTAQGPSTGNTGTLARRTAMASLLGPTVP